MTEMNTYFSFKGNSNPVGTPTRYFGIQGTVGETEEQWRPSNPLSLNDPSSSTGVLTTATTGDLVVVKIYKNSSWTQVGSITLENKNQTLRVNQ